MSMTYKSIDYSHTIGEINVNMAAADLIRALDMGAYDIAMV